MIASSTPISVLFIIAITILGLFVLNILSKKRKSVSDYTLILLNLLCGCLLYFSIQIGTQMSPIAFFLSSTLPFWFFSVFLVYASQLISNKAWQNHYWLFFLLSIPMTLYLYYDVFWAHEDFPSILAERFLHPPLLYHIFYKGNMIFSILLCYDLWKKLKIYVKAVQDHFSYIEKMRLKWLNHYTIALIGLNTFSLIAFLTYNVGWIENIDKIYSIINAFLIIAFFYFAYHGVRHYSMETVPFLEEEAKQKTIKKTEVPTAPQTNTSEEDHKSQKIYRELIQLFEETNLYTQPQLKLSDVAQKMNVPPHQLSQIINKYHGRAFYDFVATYRVNLLKERLTDANKRQFTILSLGMECGFNSKASLNRVFKEHTGLTPSQFQKSHLPK